MEPAGIVEVKYRAGQQLELMHRLDPEISMLDAQLENAASAEVGPANQELEARVRAREEKLAPLYTQIACEFADLHDRAGRMLAKGVIRRSLEWRNSREFFYWRVRRRLLEQDAVQSMRQADPDLDLSEAKRLLESWTGLGDDDDKAAVVALQGLPLEEKVEGLRLTSLKRRLINIYEQLPPSERVDLAAAPEVEEAEEAVHS